MLKTFSITDIGRKRRINQDYICTQETPIGNLPNVFLLADGMGGHKAGDYASRTTVETIIDLIGRDKAHTKPSEIFEDAIKGANKLIYEKALTDSALEGMGTTIVAASFTGNALSVANVGDSRLYIIGDRIRQITRDHSLVEEMVRMGTIDREEARNHPKKNIITRAVGVNLSVEPDFFEVELKEGEIVLLCSDGLSNMLEDEEIQLIVKKGRDVVEIAQTLIEAANRNGGGDNVSVVLIDPLA